MMLSTEITAVAVIPTHLASVRFPGKILFEIDGLPMIEHVRRRALLCSSLDRVIVATCDDEIASVVNSYGGDVIMTSSHHRNGTSRVAEAVRNIDCSHVVLVQGDEPLLLPTHLDMMISAIRSHVDIQAWNATAPIIDALDLDRHSFVKCIVSSSDRILYCFRRSPCYSSPDIQFSFVRKILGLIAFQKDFLLSFDSLSPSQIERHESIEQMRIVDNNISFMSVPVSPSLPSVNEPIDVDIVLKYCHSDPVQLALRKKIAIEPFQFTN